MFGAGPNSCKESSSDEDSFEETLSEVWIESSSLIEDVYRFILKFGGFSIKVLVLRFEMSALIFDSWRLDLLHGGDSKFWVVISALFVSSSKWTIVFYLAN